ncbi:MAG TPA: PH domain-containing protein [Bryobacteraceae bacterium]|nr:PH domain-containing protein [Bryobacteraceae bacterium]
MSEVIIRPTAKFLKAGTILTALVFLALEGVYFAYWREKEILRLLPLVIPLIFLWPLARWLRRRYTRAVISGDRLRYETGFTSKTTRNIQLSKLQDVRVDQGLLERMLNIGDISIETSGEASRLTIRNVDRPQSIADELMNRSQSGTAAS